MGGGGEQTGCLQMETLEKPTGCEKIAQDLQQRPEAPIKNFSALPVSCLMSIILCLQVSGFSQVSCGVLSFTRMRAQPKLSSFWQQVAMVDTGLAGWC